MLHVFVNFAETINSGRKNFKKFLSCVNFDKLRACDQFIWNFQVDLFPDVILTF